MRSRKSLTSKFFKPRVGVTLGDPSGIGPEIINRALDSLEGLYDITVIGDSWVLRQARTPGSRNRVYKAVDLNNISREKFRFGKVSAEYGRASIEYLDTALEMIEKRKLDCLVTCPISKESIKLSGFNHAGHTGYLAQRTKSKDTAMMLLNKFLKITLVTQHIPLKKVASSITKEGIIKAFLLTRRSMKDLFLIEDPRIGICGLNPHSSDNGLIGREETDILRPAIKELKLPSNILEPVDIAMAKAVRGYYHAVIAMYHDQALIPLKVSDGASGVNLTLGLPFIRTSPLHGTAFDIAGKNKADPSSLIAAINLAVKCSQNQKK